MTSEAEYIDYRFESKLKMYISTENIEDRLRYLFS